MRNVIGSERPKLVAAEISLSQLWRDALKHGHPWIWLNQNGEAVAKIDRPLGNSKVETKHCRADTPERALLEAIQEAELWGLPALA